LSVLQQQQASEFADIKTHADVQKLATDDPFRFAQWQARQMQINAQAQEVEHLNRQREQEKANTFKTWAEEQDSKFTKKFPEFADKEKAGKVREGIVSYLTNDIGVPEGHLPELWDNPTCSATRCFRKSFTTHRASVPRRRPQKPPFKSLSRKSSVPASCKARAKPGKPTSRR
jgi:hypothetical protein